MSKSIDAARLKVTLEASSAPMKKEMEKAKQITKAATSSMNKELGKVRNPLKSAFSGNDVMTSVKNIRQKMKESMNSITPKNLQDSFKGGKVKQFQLDAGIKVHTDEFNQVEADITKVENKLKRLELEEKALRELGADQGMSEKYRKVKVSADEAQIALDKLLKKKEELEASGDAFEFTPKYQGLYDSYNEEKAKLSEMKSERGNRKSNGMGQWSITENGKLVNLEKEIAKTEAHLQKLGAEMEAMENKDKMLQPTETMQKLGENIDSTRDKLGKYKTEMTSLTASGLADGTEEWIKNQQAIAGCSREMKKYNALKKELEKTKTDVTKPVSFGGQAINFGKSVASFTKGAALKGWGGITKIFGGMKSVLSGVTSTIKKTSGVFGALIQKFVSGIPLLGRFNSGLKQTGGGMGSSLKNVLKYTLGIRSLFALVNRLRSAAVEGFKNLAQYSDSTNGSISLLMSSLTQLKNAFAAAFAPILNVVAPILNSFIQKIISVVNAFGQLTSALTGGNTYIRAKKLNQNYAASLNQNAASAKNAKKANEDLKRTILGFDQINKMDDNDNSDTGSDAGSDMGGGISPGDMFETVQIENKFKDLAKKLKDAWKNADFTEIGAMVGRKLNSALESIPWDKIQSTCNRIAKSVATFLNGFIETTNWGLVGSTISRGINTAFEMANTFATNFHWDSLGLALGNGLNGALGMLDWELIQETIHNVVSGIISSINNFIHTADWNLVGSTIGEYWNSKLEIFRTAVTEFDWPGAGTAFADAVNGIINTVDFTGIGETFSTGLKGLLDFGITALQGIEWRQLGEKVWEGLKAIDWNGIADKTFELLGSAFGGLAAFLGGLISEKVQEAKDYFQQKIEECGGNIALGILKGIKDAILGIGGWIKEHIFTPFIDGFKNAFGIHSPSTVMAEMGGYLMDGLLGGIKGLVEDVVGVFTGIGDRIGETWENITTAASTAWEGISTTVGDAWESLKTTASEKFGNIKESVSGAWDTVSTKTGEIWGSVKKTAGGVWDWLTGKSEKDFSEIQKNTEDSFNSAEKTTGTAWGASQKSVTDALNSMKGESSKSMRQVYANVKSYTQSISNISGNTWEGIGKKISAVLKDMKQETSSVLDSVAASFSNLGNKISRRLNLSEIGRSAAQSFANGFQSVYIKTPRMYVSGYDNHYFGNGGNIPTPRFSVEWYASGGFPNAGEMFIARERGPELVGRMGNRNAVANNSQIIDGIRAGVFEAVVNAFESMGNQKGGDKEIHIHLDADAKKMFKVVREEGKKYQNSTGQPVFD